MPEPSSRLSPTARAPHLLLPTYVLAKLGRLAQRATQESIADQQLLLPHFSVLTTLEDLGPLAQNELADRLGLNGSHLVRYIDDLEQRSAVQRDRDPGDRRRQLVSLTDAGRTLLARMRAPIDQVQEQFLAILSESERTALMGLLLRLLDHADSTLGSDHDVH